MTKGSGTGGILAVVAIIACCALPLLAVTAGGALLALGGLAARYWPIAVLGVVLAAWAGVKLGWVIRPRNRKLRVRESSGR